MIGNLAWSSGEPHPRCGDPLGTVGRCARFKRGPVGEAADCRADSARVRPPELLERRVRHRLGRLEDPAPAPDPASARAPTPAGARRRERSAEHDGDDEDAAVDDLEVGGIDRERGEEVLEEVDRDRTEQGSEEAAPTAHEGRAAEHDGGDRHQGVLRCRRGVGRAHETGQRQAGEAGEEPAERVAGHPHRADVDATGEGRRVVAPDGIEEAAERDESQAEPDEQRQPDREEATGHRADGLGEMPDPPGARHRHRIRGDEEVDALEGEERRERDDDRLDAQPDDEQAVERPDRHAEGQHDRDRDRAAEPVRGEPDDEDAVREEDQRRDRDVEAAADDRRRARQRGDRHWSDVGQLVRQPEAAVLGGEGREQQPKGEEQGEAEAVGAQEPLGFEARGGAACPGGQRERLCHLSPRRSRRRTPRRGLLVTARSGRARGRARARGTRAPGPSARRARRARSRA